MERVPELNIEIGIITTPPERAQRAASQLVEASHQGHSQLFRRPHQCAGHRFCGICGLFPSDIFPDLQHFQPALKFRKFFPGMKPERTALRFFPGFHGSFRSEKDFIRAEFCPEPFSPAGGGQTTKEPSMNFLPVWAAFSFLTRLVPSRIFSERDMADSMRWAPLVGLVLGAAALIPLCAGIALTRRCCAPLSGLPSWPGQPAPCTGTGWPDAWTHGAAEHAENNSRPTSRTAAAGSFGVLAMILTLALQAAALAAIFSDAFPGAWWPALLAPAWGRANMLLPPALLPPHPFFHAGPPHGSRMLPVSGRSLARGPDHSLRRSRRAASGTDHPCAVPCRSAFSVSSCPT